MANLTNSPYPTYMSNKAAAAVLASLIGISLIAWIFQSIQAHFQPRRPMILILFSHLTIVTELIIRAALSTDTRNSRAAFTATSVLLAVGQRTIILANYDFLTQVDDSNPCRSRTIIIGSILGAVGSAILTIPAGILSYNIDTIDQSFRLRQAAAAIVLCMTILFYPICFVTKAVKNMTKQAIILLIVSSFTSLIVAIYLQVTSVPYFYVAANEHEFWFYIFQLTPIAIALFTWTILHPKRSLVSVRRPKNEIMKDISTRL
jgi:cytochrome bd-type quinol oxidase subunit 2